MELEDLKLPPWHLQCKLFMETLLGLQTPALYVHVQDQAVNSERGPTSRVHGRLSPNVPSLPTPPATPPAGPRTWQALSATPNPTSPETTCQ